MELGRSLLVPCVQELAKGSLTEVPTRYICPNQDHSTTTDNPCPDVPILDMMGLISGDDRELKKLDSACKDWGFFQLINHGVSHTLLENIKMEILKFFNLPLEEKKMYWQSAGDVEGFGQAFVQSEEQSLDWGDMFFLKTLPTNHRKPHLFPKLPTPFRDHLETYATELKQLALKILNLMAKALGMNVEDIMEPFEDGTQSMRMNYYPPCPEPEKVIGLAPHSDGGGLTILLQISEVEGLQIKKNGNWIPVKPLPDALIINIGDMLECRGSLDVYTAELEHLSMKIINCMAEALEMDPQDMKDLFQEGMQSMRINYYPPCPQPDKVIGITPHSDVGALTILLQLNETEGLQVKKDEVWVPIKPLPDAFIINIGDTMEMVTNGAYRSIEHRAVVDSSKERLSIAIFHNARLDAEMGPAPSLITEEKPAVFKRIGVREFLKGIFARKLHEKSYLDTMRI